SRPTITSLFPYTTLFRSSSAGFQYDLNGNLTSDGTRTFEYDAENQLTNVFVSGQWRTGLAYDAFGRLRIRKEYNWQSGAWVQSRSEEHTSELQSRENLVC